MKIELSGNDCERILKIQLFQEFGKVLNCISIDEMEFDLDCSYSKIDRLTILKKQEETNEI